MPLKLKNNNSSVIINSEEFYISPIAWKELNFMFSKDEIKEAISNAIEENGIPVPKDEISFEDGNDWFKNGKWERIVRQQNY